MIKPSATGRIAAAALGIALFAGSRAEAGDHCPPSPPCGHYETILVTECFEVPYTRIVTRYDHCGRPYEFEKSGVRKVEVTARKRVFVRD